MSTARTKFLEHLAAYRSATQTDVIISHAPTETQHNTRARLFRNGLAVVGYAMVEDFIKTRTAEVLQRIGSGATSFTALPNRIKIAATSGVLNALKYQERFLDQKSSDYFHFYQQHASSIASTENAAYEISTLAFANDRPNITTEDIADILSAFCIDNPWSALGSVASKCNVGVLDLKSLFENATNRRYIAAHQANADIETSDLVAFGTEIIGLALGFDLLISRALRKILDADSDYLTQRTKIAGRHISIRFLQFDGSWWREVVDGNKRAHARLKDFAQLKADCFQRARISEQALVIKGDKGLPAEWCTPDVD